LADVDTDGDAVADDVATLAALGISDAEREKLAALYPQPPKTLWRVPIAHFTPWDCNWPYGPPMDAEPPTEPAPSTDRTEDEGCEGGGSIIECQNQILGERIPILGTPFTLNYRSDRVRGRVAAPTLNIPLSGASVPESLAGINLDIQLAGRRFAQSFPPDPNQRTAFTWDGRDAYGRTVQGKQRVTVRVGYAYKAVYYPVPADRARSFGLMMPPGAVPTMAASFLKEQPSGQNDLYEVVGSRDGMTIEYVETWKGQVG
jgi:hypothetical protein